MTFPSSEDSFEDIEARYPFTLRRMKYVSSMKIYEIVLGMMLTTSETMPHQLSSFRFAALGHLFGLQLTHKVLFTYRRPKVIHCLIFPQ